MTTIPAPYSVSVAGVVVREDRRLLVVRRRDNGRWEPPGGVLEPGEPLQDGVRREVAEETGVDVEVQRLTGVYQNLRQGVVALVFRCRPIAGVPGPSVEAAEALWLPLEEAVRLMVPAFAVRVQDAFTDEVPARVHDGFHLLAPASGAEPEDTRGGRGHLPSPGRYPHSW